VKNWESFDELTALYALDLLDASESSQIEALFLRESVLRSRLAVVQDALSALAYAVEPMQPSAHLKERLFQRLQTNLSKPTVHDRVTDADASVEPGHLSELQCQARQVAWVPYSIPGVQWSQIHLDPDKREFTYFVQALGTIQFPAHRHAGIEEIIVLAGDLIVNNLTYQAGDRITSSVGTVHQPATLQGCIILVRTSLDDEIL
jgi:anti-sigma factor ChrR (cupin superfamily)